jgi:porin
MKSLIGSILSVCLLGFLTASTASAEDDRADSGNSGQGDTQQNTFGSDPQDPSNFLHVVEKRRAQRDSLFPISPLKPLHDILDPAEEALYDATKVKIGLTINHLFQGMTDALPGLDKWGTTTDSDLVAAWEVIDQGEPTQGKFYFHLEGRWDYGTTGPQNLGFVNLGSQIGTGNAFSAYDPTFLIRNLYWEQGSPEAGWAYRFGKITTDAILGTSKHITPVTTFLPNAGTGFFVDGFPDSGVGAVGALYFNDRFKAVGLVSDANANRFTWGNPGAGDYYTALELAAKIVPGTGNVDFSKLTLWHTDGTDTGLPINASTGKEGWGYSLKYEQELTDDGRGIGIARWGQSFNGSALYKYQAGLNFLYYDPDVFSHVQNDLVGLGLNWVEPTAAGSRDEYNVEVFYRLPLFPGVDTTFSYQSVIHPALAPDIDHASVFSLRLRSVF